MSSLVSNSTDGSTKVLLNPKEHKKAPTSAEDKVVSWFRRNKAPKEAKEATEVKYQPLSEPGAMPPAGMGSSTFYADLLKQPGSNSPSSVTGNTDSPSGSSVPPTPPKPPVPPKLLAGNLANEQKKQQGRSTPRSGSDSGINSPNPSGPSTPTGRRSPVNLGFLTPIPVMLTDKGGRVKTQADLKKTDLLDVLVGQPSTTIDVDTDVQRQTIPKTV